MPDPLYDTVLLRGGPAGDGRLYGVPHQATEIRLARDARRPTVLTAVDPAIGALGVGTTFQPSGRRRVSDGLPIWTPDGAWPV